MNKQDLNRAINQNSRSLVAFTEIEAARKASRAPVLPTFVARGAWVVQRGGGASRTHVLVASLPT